MGFYVVLPFWQVWATGGVPPKPNNLIWWALLSHIVRYTDGCGEFHISETHTVEPEC